MVHMVEYRALRHSIFGHQILRALAIKVWQMCQLKEDEVSYIIYKYMLIETKLEDKNHRYRNSSRTHISRKLLKQYADERFLVLGNLLQLIG